MMPVLRRDDNPQETAEWMESLDYVSRTQGQDRAQFLLEKLRERAFRIGVPFASSATTPYINTIPVDQQPDAFGVGLSFNQIPSKLVIPYSAITGFHDPAVNFELRFQAQEGPDGPEPHDEAENDGPTHVPVEDGSNVVAVDFKRKK